LIDLRYSDQKKNLAFSTTALSFDTTSAAIPDEYRHKPYIARNHRPGLHLFRRRKPGNAHFISIRQVSPTRPCYAAAAVAAAAAAAAAAAGKGKVKGPVLGYVLWPCLHE